MWDLLEARLMYVRSHRPASKGEPLQVRPELDGQPERSSPECELAAQQSQPRPEPAVAFDYQVR
jgi:hypothetical protein